MRLTILLVLIAAVLFFYPFLALDDVPAFYDRYGFSYENFLAHPEVIVTSIFLHGSLEHLLANALIWLFFGFAVEEELGNKRYLLIFFLGAFAGEAFALFFHPGVIAVGASAGIFALIGVGMLVRPLDMSFYPLVVPVPLILLGLAYIAYNIYGFFFLPASNISYAAHFGGLFVGLAFGLRRVGAKKATKRLVFGLLALSIIAMIVMALMG